MVNVAPVSRTEAVSAVVAAAIVIMPACVGGGPRHDAGQSTSSAPPQLEVVEVGAEAGVVVAGSREAADAGAAILAAGGNAIDAAVAAGFVLFATETGTTGLGGAAVALVVGPEGLGTVIGGPPVVPLRVDMAEVERLHGENRPWGYPTIAVPTAPAVLGHLHRRFGTMPWAEVLAPAIAWAERGGAVTPLHRAAAETYRDRLAEQPVVAALLLDDDGTPFPVGSRRPNPRLAETLRQLAANGVETFYRGALAAAIDADMKAGGGPLRRADLARVRVRESAPVRGRYRDLEVLAAAPPFGGAEVVRALEILDALPEERLRTDGPDRCHALVEAVRISLAMRGRRAQPWPPWLSAADASDVPAALARRIRFDRALRDDEIAVGPSAPVTGGTNHLVAADRWGRVVSMSMSIGLHFGAARMNEELGFLYNNFIGWTEAGRPETPPTPAAGTVLPSALSPVVLRREDGWTLALGSAGSDRIPSSVVAVVSAVVDRGRSLADAVSGPRVLWGGPVDRRVYLEIATPSLEGWADVLVERGFTEVYRQRFPARPFDLAAFGGTNALATDVDRGGWVGVADPRRGGAAAAAMDGPVPGR
jgi:gamma-glutamyltranspeptidase/glutathione hydrolase